VHDWVEWIFIDHNNQPHHHNNNPTQDISTKACYQAKGGIIYMPTDGFTSLPLVLDQFFSITPKHFSDKFCPIVDYAQSSDHLIP
jgi:hypothetical protein